jgi:hypothetical protein
MSAILAYGLAAIAQEPLPAGPGQSPPPKTTKQLDYRELEISLSPGQKTFSVLLKNPLVVDELELSDDQKARLIEAEKKQQEVFTDYFKQQQKEILEARNRGDVDEVMRLSRLNGETVTRMKDEADVALARKVLNRHQTDRLKEIQAQAEGSYYFDRVEVREKLGLEPEQIQDLQRINTENLRSFKAAVQIPSTLIKPEPGGDTTLEAKTYAANVQATQTRVARVRVTTMKSIEQVLTKAQRGAYKKLVGKPFDFSKPKTQQTDENPAEKPSKTVSPN